MPHDLPSLWKLAWKTQRSHFTTRHHGIEHWVRVERNGLWLARQVPGVDVLVVRLFAALHDCQRRNDGWDPEHGPRAHAAVGWVAVSAGPSAGGRALGCHTPLRGYHLGGAYPQTRGPMHWQPEDEEERQLQELTDALKIAEVILGREAVEEILLKNALKRRDEILAKFPDSVAADLIREHDAASEGP